MANGPLSSTLDRARRVRTEMLATLREAVLMPRDLTPVVPPLEGGEEVVVLVHGFLATAGVFRPMRAELEREGFHVVTFSHAPGRSVASVAKQLKKVIDRIPRASSRAGVERETRVHVVGHSMGGIVARYYVQHLGGHERVTQTFSLASPFHGAPRARRFAWLARDMQPESKVLEAIRACPPNVRVPHTSIVAGSDDLIPPESARFPGSSCVVLPDRGHNTLLFDPDVMRILLKVLKHDVKRAA